MFLSVGLRGDFVNTLFSKHKGIFLVGLVAVVAIFVMVSFGGGQQSFVSLSDSAYLSEMDLSGDLAGHAIGGVCKTDRDCDSGEVCTKNGCQTVSQGKWARQSDDKIRETPLGRVGVRQSDDKIQEALLGKLGERQSDDRIQEAPMRDALSLGSSSTEDSDADSNGPPYLYQLTGEEFWGGVLGPVWDHTSHERTCPSGYLVNGISVKSRTWASLKDITGITFSCSPVSDYNLNDYGTQVIRSWRDVTTVSRSTAFNSFLGGLRSSTYASPVAGFLPGFKYNEYLESVGVDHPYFGVTTTTEHDLGHWAYQNPATSSCGSLSGTEVYGLKGFKIYEKRRGGDDVLVGLRPRCAKIVKLAQN